MRMKERRTRRRLVFSVCAGVLAVLVLACTGAAAGATTWVVDGDGGAGVDFCEIQAAAGVDRVHSTCASAGLCACSKRDSNPCKKIDYHSKS